MHGHMNVKNVARCTVTWTSKAAKYWSV